MKFLGSITLPSPETLTLSALTAGSVLFAGTGGVVSQDNSNFFWDNTNHRLGLGKTNPATLLDVNGTVTATLFSGSGASLTTLNASNLSSGTVPAAQMPALTGDVTSPVGSVATTCVKIQGVAISTSSPSTNQVLAYVSSNWAPTDPIQNGATVVTSPRTGQPFFQNPTGRKSLLIYDGSAWSPIMSSGDITVYVDTTGTDDVNHGTGTGSNAYATLGYALSQIPENCGGNVTINMGSGTFAESVTIQDKNLPVGCTLTIVGTLTQLDSLTASALTAGSNNTGGTMTRGTGTWTSNQRQNKLLFDSTLGVYNIIDSNTTTVVTAAGYLTGGSNNDGLVVYDWGTIVAPSGSGPAITVGYNQANVVLKNLKLVGHSTTSFGLSVLNESIITLYNCWITSSVTTSGAYPVNISGGIVTFNQCVITLPASAQNYPINATSYAQVTLNSCRIDGSNLSVASYCVSINYNSVLSLSNCSTITGSAGNSSGVLLNANCILVCGRTNIRTQVWGVVGQFGGRSISIANLAFTSCTSGNSTFDANGSYGN